MTTVNRILAALIAAVLLVAAAIGLSEIVLAALDRPPWLVPREDWATWLREHARSSFVIRAALAGLVLLGLLWVFAGLRNGRPSALRLYSEAPDVRMTASRRALEKVIADAARRTDGVTTADASVRRGSVKVTAATRLRDPGDLRQRITSAVQDRLRDVDLVQTLTPTVQVNRRDGT